MANQMDCTSTSPNASAAFARPTELILALDLPDKAQAFAMLDRVGSSLQWVKVGLQLFLRYGPDLVDQVAARGYKVFLDLKLHDIPNTVASAIGSLEGRPVDLLTIHAVGGAEMAAAAAQAARKALPKASVLAVTVLTSMDQAGLNACGVSGSVEDQVLRLGRLVLEEGVGGLVCSPHELPLLRRELGGEPLLVTPGVRPADAEAGDQKRIMTPAQARAGGSSHIVVGRPILKAADPAAAARAILADLGDRA